MYNTYIRIPKRLLLIFFVVFLLGGVGYLFIQSLTPSLPLYPAKNSVSPTISTSQTVLYCNPHNVQTSLTLSPTAGNIYGTFTVKNISSRTCQILGKSFINVSYDKNAVKNISVTYQGQTQSQPFILSPNQIIYSQVHYPNGPQCQSIGIHVTNVTFTYNISPTNTVIFKNQNGNIQQEVETCKSPTDITDIQIWNMSSQPITP